ncbi:hypothetical protein C5S32_00260 [ANME-1 cluster archaeon GoMg1]|nr:hypothetical protein [ANME-1 cluster archaeon GoMg1]
MDKLPSNQLFSKSEGALHFQTTVFESEVILTTLTSSKNLSKSVRDAFAHN